MFLTDSLSMGERIVLLLEYMEVAAICCSNVVAVIGWCFLSLGKLSNLSSVGAIEVLLVNNKSKQIAH